MTGQLSSDLVRPRPRGWKTLHQGTGAIIISTDQRKHQRRTTADPIIIKHAATNLAEDVPCGRLERSIDIGTALSARLDKEQTFFLRPPLALLDRDLSSLGGKVVLVADEDAG